MIGCWPARRDGVEVLEAFGAPLERRAERRDRR